MYISLLVLNMNLFLPFERINSTHFKLTGQAEAEFTLFTTQFWHLLNVLTKQNNVFKTKNCLSFSKERTHKL